MYFSIKFPGNVNYIENAGALKGLGRETEFDFLTKMNSSRSKLRTFTGFVFFKMFL